MKNFTFFFCLLTTPVLATTLKDVLSEAKNHVNAQNLELNIQSKKYDYQSSLLSWAPQLSFEREWMDESRTRSSRDFDNEDSMSLNARLNLFHGFADIGRFRSSSSALKASEFMAKSEWLSIELNIAELYFKCLSEKELVGIAERALEIRLDLENVAKKRFNRGSLSKDEYIKLEIDRHLAENDLSTQKYRLNICVRDLKYWAQNLEGPIQSIDLLEKIRNSTSTPSELKKHPDWLTLENQTESDRWSIWAEGGNLLPEIDLNYGHFPETSFQEKEKTVSLNFTWELFGGGDDLTSYRKAKVNHRIGQNLLIEFEQDWQRKIENATSQVKERLENYERNVKNSALAGEIYQAGLRRFQSGSISSSEVALDQSRLIEARRARWEVWYELHQSWLSLLAVQGLGVEGFL